MDKIFERIIAADLSRDFLRIAVVQRFWKFTRVKITAGYPVPEGQDPVAFARSRLKEHAGKGMGTGYTLLLSEKDAVEKLFVLPRVEQGEISGLLGFEIERHIPYAVSELVYDYIPIDENNASPEAQIKLLVVAAKKKIVEEKLGIFDDRAGVKSVDYIGLVPYYFYNYFVREKNGLTAAVYVGPSTTVVNLIDGASILWLKVMSLGSDDLRQPRDDEDYDGMFTEENELKPSLLADYVISELKRSPYGDRLDSMEKLYLYHDPGHPELTEEFKSRLRSAVLSNQFPARLKGQEAHKFLPVLSIGVKALSLNGKGVNLVRQEQKSKTTGPMAAAAAFILALLLFTAGYYLNMKDLERKYNHLRERSGAVASGVRLTLSKREKTGRLRGRIGLITGFQRENADYIKALAELHRINPGGTVIETVEVKGRALALYGYTDSLEKLLGAYTSSPVLENIDISRSLTRRSAEDGEYINYILNAEIKR